ncbi:MAG: nitrous oxide-stimulated promoter family protein [Desulfuromonadia bacterium]
MNGFTKEQIKDIRLLFRFTELYCRLKHGGEKMAYPLPDQLSRHFRKGVLLCTECTEFMGYALMKRSRCPLDPKPSCKHCHIHCYSAGYRARVREIMAFSGKRFILRGRLDYLWHYFF